MGRYVTREEWPGDAYPAWAHGAGYVVSMDLVRHIAVGAALKPLRGRIFKLEDVAMGSWLDFVKRDLGIAIRMVCRTPPGHRLRSSAAVAADACVAHRARCCSL